MRVLTHLLPYKHPSVVQGVSRSWMICGISHTEGDFYGYYSSTRFTKYDKLFKRGKSHFYQTHPQWGWVGKTYELKFVTSKCMDPNLLSPLGGVGKMYEVPVSWGGKMRGPQSAKCQFGGAVSNCHRHSAINTKIKIYLVWSKDKISQYPENTSASQQDIDWSP